jgi:hypothetical protein
MDPLRHDIAFPLYFAAPVSWYVNIVKEEKIQLAEEPNFNRQTQRNRLSYGTFQGSRSFSIPLSHNSIHGTYKDVKINYNEHWQNQLIHALQTSYGKSPFFEFYGYRFENIINAGHIFLWDLNQAMLLETLRSMKLMIPVENVITRDLKPLDENKVNPYYQVFNERTAFLPHLSILDLIYNEGPDARDFLYQPTEMESKK